MHFLLMPINSLLDAPLFRAISWTLLHSLWQGLLLALAAALLIAGTKKSSASWRYVLLISMFFVFLAACGITFFRELGLSRLMTVALPQGPVVWHVVANIRAQAPGWPEETMDLRDRVSGFLNANAPWLVLIWFGLICLRAIRLTAELAYVHRLRHRQTSPPALFWRDRIAALANCLSIRRQIVLMESALIEVPLMTGVFKPMILFPISLLSQLPPEQVEVALLHELAHIRRQDFLVNLIQRLAELLFFFNPGLLWVSSLIRDERENCCDDLVLAARPNGKALAEALLSFEEVRPAIGRFALGFPGRSSQLLERVRHILYHHNKTVNNMEKTLLAAGVAILTLSVLGFGRYPQKDPGRHPATEIPLASSAVLPLLLADTLPPLHNEGNYSIQKKGDSTVYTAHGYQITMVDRHPVRLLVDGKEIPAASIGNYGDRIREIIAESAKRNMQMQQDMARMNVSEQEMMAKRESMEQQRKAMEELERAQVELKGQMDDELSSKEATKEMNEKMKELTMDKINLALKQQALALKMAKDATVDKLNRELDGSTLLEENRELEKALAKAQQGAELENAQEFALKAEQFEKLKDQLLRADQELDRAKAATAYEALSEARHQPSEEFMKRHIEPIIHELTEEKLIKDPRNFSFELNNEVLIVNHVQQSGKLHARLREKYLSADTEDLIRYSVRDGQETATYHLPW
jgi:bla regulator protein BlaR1